MNTYLVYGIGLTAQALFFGRTILQWFKSENEGEIISPVMYWKISIAASLLMILYGIFRHDFVILLGQMIVYCIYIRNLQLKNAWVSIHPVFRSITIGAPAAVIIWLLTSRIYSFESIANNHDIAPWLMVWGITGQLVFSFRFIFQWIHSEKEKESVLPLKFWIISTIGALIILVYAIFRLDPVLFISNSLGMFVYIRNILIFNGSTGIFSRINSRFVNNLTGKISKKIN